VDDLGSPVAPLALADGVPVYDAGGRRIGVVDRVVMDEGTGIFEGLIIHTLPLPGGHLYAGHEQIAELRERGVVLSVDRSELPELSESAARERASRQTPESALEARLRKAWDWLTGVR
jgi:sporulation protein YlmC with PRC-barrel domain